MRRLVASYRFWIWSAVLAVLVLSLTGSAVVVFGTDQSEEPPFLNSTATTTLRPVIKKRTTGSDRIWIAGSGMCLPIVKVLAAAFCEARHVQPCDMEVLENVGSGGGIAAAHDGAVELGLASRPLTPNERAFGLEVRPFARVAMVYAVHPSVEERDLQSAELQDIFDGKRRRWQDGSHIVVLLRSRTDPVPSVRGRPQPGYKMINDESEQGGRFRVIYGDREMQDALLSTQGAIGLLDQGAILLQHLPLRVLNVDGQVPSAETVTTGAYPYSRPLAFVMKGTAQARVREFIDFATGPDGQRIITESGYALPGASR